MACVPKDRWFGIGFNGTEKGATELVFFFAGQNDTDSYVRSVSLTAPHNNNTVFQLPDTSSIYDTDVSREGKNCTDENYLQFNVLRPFDPNVYPNLAVPG